MNLLVLIGVLVAITAMAQTPCGVPSAVTVYPTTPTIIGTFGIAGTTLNLTCAYGSLPSDATALVPLGITCGASTTGPYYSFPTAPFNDYVSTPTLFTCPFPSATWSLVAYNPYPTPVTVMSVALGYIQSKLDVTSRPNVTLGGAAPQPLVCGASPYTMTITGKSSVAVLSWTSAGTQLSLQCFGIYSDRPSDIVAALACSPYADFSKNVVSLVQLPQWGPQLGWSVTCPFNGYFGIIVGNRATSPALFSYYASGMVNSDTTVRKH